MECSQDPDRQPRGNCLPRDSHSAAHGHRYRCCVLRRRCGCLARVAWRTRPCISGRRRHASPTFVVRAYRRGCRSTGAEAVHPGYGFLSEKADFSELCRDSGVVFIGPPASAIRVNGFQVRRQGASWSEAGVPLVPGYHGDEQDLSRLSQAAEKLGYPVLLKAAAGGGGKGMRLV